MPNGLEHLPRETLDRLRRTYLGHMVETRAALAPLVARAADRTAGPDEYAALQRHAHKLGGSGASYGYDDLSLAGKALDSVMRTEPGATDTIGRAALALLAAVDGALADN